MNTEFLRAERSISERALLESEQRYKRLLSATTDYIYTVELRDGVSGATSHGLGCESVTGYTPFDFAADPYLWYQVIHEEDRPAVIAQVDRILKNELPPPLEHRIIHKDGRVRWIRNAPIPHRDNQGRLLAYDGLISDITDQKRGQQFLNVQHAVASTLVESYQLPEAASKILQALCTGLLWDHVVYWSFDPGNSRLSPQTAAHRRPLRVEQLGGDGGGVGPDLSATLPGLVAGSGEAVWIPDLAQASNVFGYPIPGGDGLRCGCAVPVRSGKEVAGVIALFSRELREPQPMLNVLCGIGAHLGEFINRRRAEQALRESQERLELVIKGSNDGIWDWDMTTGETYFSPRWKSMIGYREDELKNHFSTWEGLLHPDDRDPALAKLNAYFAGETSTFELEHRLRHKDGTFRWILARGVALRNGRGVPLRMAGSHVDLTELKAAAERLQQANAKLASRSDVLKKLVRQLHASHRELKETQLQLIQAAKLESVGTLAAGVAHEVKNPLQTIIMGLHFVSRKVPADDPDVALTVSDMREAVKRANSIIGDLLSFSAATVFQKKPENLHLIIDNSLRLLRNDLVSSNVAVVSNFARYLPAVEIDQRRIEQVLIIVVLNAIHAMPKGGTLSVTTRALVVDREASLQALILRHFKPGDRVILIEVQDTGTGIPDSALPRVFDPFFTTKPVGVGTGLGLSIAKKIVDLHSGAIEIKNTPPRGVLVTVALKV